MPYGLRFTPKPDAFCVTIISWEAEGEAPVYITEVYHGPEEHSSRGPFFDCSYRWELYRGYDSLQFFLWTYKTRNGYQGEDHDRFEIYRGTSQGQSWERSFSSSPGGFVGKG